MYRESKFSAYSFNFLCGSLLLFDSIKVISLNQLLSIRKKFFWVSQPFWGMLPTIFLGLNVPKFYRAIFISSVLFMALNFCSHLRNLKSSLATSEKFRKGEYFIVKQSIS